MISTLISIGLCLPTLAIVTALPQEATEPRSSKSAGVDATAQDIEALRNLLTKEIQSALDRTEPAAGGSSNAAKRVAKKGGDADEGGSAEDPDTKPSEASDGARAGTASVYGLGSARTLHTYDLAYSLFRDRKAGTMNSAWRGVRSSTSFTRGFYCPGVGVWIDTTVSLPVVFESVKESSKAEGRASEDDAWDQALREATGEPSALPRNLVGGTVLESQFDPKSHDAVISAAKGLLVRYGKRVRNLGNDESVVIALKLEGDSSGIYSQPLTIAEEDDLTVDESGNTVLKPGVPNYAQAVIAPPKSKTVVLRVLREHLAALAAGDLDEGALRKRIQVTEY